MYERVMASIGVTRNIRALRSVKYFISLLMMNFVPVVKRNNKGNITEKPSN